VCGGFVVGAEEEEVMMSPIESEERAGNSDRLPDKRPETANLHFLSLAVP
jgi:hypothetical protein